MQSITTGKSLNFQNKICKLTWIHQVRNGGSGDFCDKSIIFIGVGGVDVDADGVGGAEVAGPGGLRLTVSIQDPDSVVLGDRVTVVNLQQVTIKLVVIQVKLQKPEGEFSLEILTANDLHTVH